MSRSSSVPLDLLSVLHGVRVFVCESASEPWLELLELAPLLQRRRRLRRPRRLERLEVEDLRSKSSLPNSSPASLAASLKWRMIFFSCCVAAALLHEHNNVTKILDNICISSLPLLPCFGADNSLILSSISGPNVLFLKQGYFGGLPRGA